MSCGPQRPPVTGDPSTTFQGQASPDDPARRTATTDNRARRKLRPSGTGGGRRRSRRAAREFDTGREVVPTLTASAPAVSRAPRCWSSDCEPSVFETQVLAKGEPDRARERRGPHGIRSVRRDPRASLSARRFGPVRTLLHACQVGRLACTTVVPSAPERIGLHPLCGALHSGCMKRFVVRTTPAQAARLTTDMRAPSESSGWSTRGRRSPRSRVLDRESKVRHYSFRDTLPNCRAGH